MDKHYLEKIPGRKVPGYPATLYFVPDKAGFFTIFEAGIVSGGVAGTSYLCKIYTLM